MYAIYRENAESHQITVMSTYSNYSEANFHLNQTVINYLEAYRVDKAQEIKFADSNTDLNEKIHEAGFYLKQSVIYPNRIHVFKKSRKTVAGYLWNGETFEIKESMWFGILELKTELSLTHHDFEVDNQKKVSQTFKQHGGQVRLIEELKEALDRRRFSFEVDETGNLTQVCNSNSKACGGNAFTLALTDYIRTEMPHLLELEGESD